jgi:hypothetical protein
MEYEHIREQYEAQLKTWQQNPNWNRSAGVLFHFHSGFRGGAYQILKSDNPTRRSFEQMTAHIHFHHTIEDEEFFPGLQRKFNIDKKAIEKLEKDHVTIGNKEKEVHDILYKKENATQAMHEYADLLLTHLAKEEMLLMPFLLQMRSIHDL